MDTIVSKDWKETAEADFRNFINGLMSRFSTN